MECFLGFQNKLIHPQNKSVTKDGKMITRKASIITKVMHVKAWQCM